MTEELEPAKLYTKLRCPFPWSYVLNMPIVYNISDA